MIEVSVHDPNGPCRGLVNPGSFLCLRSRETVFSISEIIEREEVAWSPSFPGLWVPSPVQQRDMGGWVANCSLVPQQGSPYTHAQSTKRVHGSPLSEPTLNTPEQNISASYPGWMLWTKHLFLSKFTCGNPNLQFDGIWRRGLWRGN